MTPSQRSEWLGCVLALLASTLMIAIQAGLQPLFAPGVPLMLGLLPVLLSALVWGFRAGLVSTVLMALALDWFFFEPIGSLAITGSTPMIQLAVFAAEGVLLSWLGGFWRRLQRTSQERAELALRKSEERLRTVVHNLPVAVYTCDREGRVTLFNQAAVELWGREPVIGKDLWCGSWRIYRTDGSPLPLDQCPMAVSLREDRAVDNEEIVIELPDGTRRHVMPHPRPIHDDSGALIGGVNMLMDITERRRADEARSLLASIVASSDDAIMSMTLEGIVTSWNSGAQRLFGYPPEDMIGQSIARVIPTERLAEEQGFLNRICRGERVEHFETVRVARDGQRLQVSLSVSPLLDSTGRIIGASKVMRDITDLKTTERALQHSERLFRASFELAAVGEALLDPDTLQFQRVNWKLCELFRCKRADLLNGTLAEMIHPDVREESCEALRRLREGAVPEYSGELRLLTLDGDPLWANITATLVPDFAGHAVQMIVVLHDMTGRKLVDQELERYRNQLEELVGARTAELKESHEKLRVSERMASLGTLSAGLGHDMGNLLLPVRLRLEAMEIKGVPPNLLEDVHAIAKCTDYLQRLANGLRLLSLDPDNATAAPGSTDLATWWPDVESFLRNALPRGTELERRIADDLPHVGVSRHRLTQAVFNLVQNAGQAMQPEQPGKVCIWAEPGRSGGIRLGVTDNGRGMTPEVRARCLEPFFTSRTRGISTGLGLALVHGIVQNSGGAIEIDSTPGRGTTFTLVLPAGSPQRVQARSASAAPGPHRALVTVRDERLRSFLCSVLRLQGIEIVAPEPRAAAADLWLTDADEFDNLGAVEYLGNNPRRRIVVIGQLPDTPEDQRIIQLGHQPRISGIRTELKSIIATVTNHADSSPQGSEVSRPSSHPRPVRRR